MIRFVRDQAGKKAYVRRAATDGDERVGVVVELGHIYDAYVNLRTGRYYAVKR